MDNLQLIETLRATCMLVNPKVSAKTSDPVPSDILKDISAAQRGAKQELFDRTIPFGERRLFQNEGFSELVNTMGRCTLDFKTALSRLDEGLRKNFALVLEYEPVPGPDDFGMLPAQVTSMLHRHVVERNAKNWRLGIEDLMIRLFHATCQGNQRVRQYHYFDRAASQQTRAVLREVTLQDLQAMARLGLIMNIENEQAFADVLNELRPLLEVSTPVLREMPDQREAMIVRTHNAAEMLHELCKPFMWKYKRPEPTVATVPSYVETGEG